MQARAYIVYFKVAKEIPQPKNNSLIRLCLKFYHCWLFLLFETLSIQYEFLMGGVATKPCLPLAS